MEYLKITQVALIGPRVAIYLSRDRAISSLSVRNI